jgi:WD40 repeat protein
MRQAVMTHLVEPPLRFARLGIIVAVAASLTSISSAQGSGPNLFEGQLPEGAVARFGSSRMRHELACPSPMPLAFSPDGRYLISSDGRTVYVWDLHDGRAVQQWENPEWVFVRRLIVSPDSRTLAIATKCGAWLAELTGEGALRRLDVFSAGEERVSGWSAFLPSENAIVSMELQTEIRVVGLASGAIRHAPCSNPQLLAGLSRDGKTITMWNQESVERWDLATLRRISSVKFPYFGKFRKLRLNNDGSLFAVNLDEGGIALWDPLKGKEVCRLTEPAIIASIGMQFAGNGTQLITVSQKKDIATVDAWNLASGKRERTMTLPAAQAGEPTVSSDGRFIAFATQATQVSLWNFSTGQPVFERSGFDHAVLAAAFAPGGRLIAADESTICCWNQSSGEVKQEISQTASISNLLVPPDGNSVIVCFRVGGPRPYDLNTGRVIGTFEAPRGLVLSQCPMSLTPNGRRLHALAYVRPGSEQMALLAWDVATGQSSIDRRLPIDNASRDQFGSFNSPYLIAGPYVAGLTPSETVWTQFGNPGVQFTPSSIVLRELSDNHTIARIAPGQSPYALSGNRYVLAVVGRHTDNRWNRNQPSDESLLEFWEISTGERIAAWSIPSVTNVILSPSGRTVAMLKQRTILLKNIDENREAIRLTPVSKATCLTFSADGRLLASGHEDGTVTIWDVGRILRVVPNQRTLSKEEREICWRDLSGDAKSSIRAGERLLSDPAGAVALFGEEVKPVDPIDPNRLRSLIADLDSPKFARRERASRQLSAWGERARPTLTRELNTAVSAETRHRLSVLLEDSAVAISPQRRRQIRAIELLERIGGSEAAAVLSRLVKGDPDARETQAAIESLQRITEK